MILLLFTLCRQFLFLLHFVCVCVLVFWIYLCVADGLVWEDQSHLVIIFLLYEIAVLTCVLCIKSKLNSHYTRLDRGIFFCVSVSDEASSLHWQSCTAIKWKLIALIHLLKITVRPVFLFISGDRSNGTWSRATTKTTIIIYKYKWSQVK